MYKKILVITLTLLCLGAAYSQPKFMKKNAESQLANEWNDKDVFEQNKLYPRANVISYGNENGIEHWKYNESPYYISLDGNWSCDIQLSVADRPNPEQKEFTAVGWKTVKVPTSQWVKQGKQLKIPMLKNAVDIPTKDNAVVTYYREFDAPKTWSDYKAYFQIQAKSAYYVWVNQEYVGYSEDSRSLSEFDITKHLKYGKPNNIVVQVVGASTGSLLEMEQDRAFCGITGDVAICLKPKTNVVDYAVVADYNGQNRVGTFTINLNVQNPNKKGQYYAEVVIWTPQGKELERMGKWMVFDKKSEVTVSLDRSFSTILPWTAETPNLYTVVVRLRNSKMELLETVGTRFGFRSVEVKDGLLLVNNSPVTLRGVLYTGYDEANNGLLSVDRMRTDLQLMKQNNINAIRTTVYSPADEHLYELCDEYGLYVVCDANLQPFSAQSKAVATDKDYVNQFIVRVQNMYENFKNHTSIIAWSLGNGVDNGIGMENAYRVLKQKDKMRLVLFSGADYSENTDIIFPRNLAVDDLKAFAVKSQTRPLILSSYGSSQGNNFGGMEALWSMIRSYNKLQGGFASMWNTTKIYDQQTAKDLTVEGLITNKQLPVPYLSELRNIYRPFNVQMISITADHGEFNVTNLLDFLALKDYVLEYNIFSNLKPRIIEGEVSVDLQPGESKNFKLKIPKLTLYSGEELFIRFVVRQRTETEAVKKGSELAVFEFPLPMNEVKKQPLPTYAREEIFVTRDSVFDGNTDKAGRIHIYNNNVDLWYDLNNANIVSYSINNHEILSAPPQLNFWRPITDNDRVDKNAFRLWQNLNPNNLIRTVVAANYRQIDKYTVGIDAMLRYTDLKGNLLFDVKQSYAVLYSGDVLLNNDIVATEQVKTIPKIGYQFQINREFDTVRWLGLDKETYCDRKQSGLIGTYKEFADELFFPYNRPQAAGNRADVHWVSLNNANEGLFVDMIDSNFNFSIYPYTDKQIEGADDVYNLKAQSFRTLNIDFLQSGIGSALAGVDIADDKVVCGKKFSFCLHLHSYSLQDAEPQDFRRVLYPTIESSVLPMPTITKNRERFDAPMIITLSSETPQSVIHYTLDGTTPTEQSPIYKTPFTIKTSTVVHAKAFKKGATASFTASQRFNFDYITSVTFAAKANTPYNYNAETILFDGEQGEITDLSRGWLGFSGSDFSGVFQLGKPIELQDVIMRFAHVPEAWAFAPTSVAVYVSSDGENYSAPIYAKIKYDPSDVIMNSPQLQSVCIEVNQPNVRYVKVVARNLGKIPAWHKAKGLRPWLLIDEIQLNEVIH